ncbi:hypothetical protein H2508_04410 [Parahaliea sp. F7430]|uniref:Glutathione S-transferase n=1 Tax=Sediminihaliea albiluteola TaxID=2758564 RepID=A0A7W2TUZ1_9GAMM|nr:hypothetical protein [Sediminihaliea albiluteola]MBA6412348.1 hypothetical protein [Sediminihaliea albiluteola]
MDYLSIAEAKARPEALRLVLSTGVPGPWGEAAKGLLSYKGLDYLPVAQQTGGSNEELLEWTGQTSAPVLVPPHAAAISHWLDLLLTLEAMAPAAPALLPADLKLRTQVLGLSALIAGVNGFGWLRRLQLLAPGMRSDDPPEMIARLAAKYGWSEEATEASAQGLADICALLDNTLAEQEARGSTYFVADSLSAVDIYWANFAGMICPLPPADNPMPEFMRSGYSSDHYQLREHITERLLAHRDFIYREHLSLPLDF